MRGIDRDAGDEGTPPILRIHFAEGERPHLFWVSDWRQSGAHLSRHKILSKSLADGSLEVVVAEEEEGGARRTLGRFRVGPGVPSGWLARWAQSLSEELAAPFEIFDLRGLQTAEEWHREAQRLGWTLS